jgi:hypothetical protein
VRFGPLAEVAWIGSAAVFGSLDANLSRDCQRDSAGACVY